MSVMKKATSRKFFLFGKYSLALLLPKKWLVEYQIEDGSIRKVELDRKKERVIISLRPTEQPSAPQETDKKEDFTPIPTLKN